jgi:WD40 repeat protein
MITCLQISTDKNILFGGSNTGNLYIWELPSGILIRKVSIHSGEIKKIVEYKSGYLMTSSQKDVKIWSLSSFYIETERSTPIKIVNSILDIIDVEYARNIFIVLTSKSVTSYLGGNEHNPFPQISKEDIEFPTTICSSLSHVYIGDCQGSIFVNEIITS